MDAISTRLHSRERRHASRSRHKSSREYEEKNSLSSLLQKKVSECNKASSCAITQNRLTMRLGLFNQGKQSRPVKRSSEGELQISKSCTRQSSVEAASSSEEHEHEKKKKASSRKERCFSTPPTASSSSKATVKLSEAQLLPSSPGFDKLSESLTEHLSREPLCADHGYLKRVKSRLSELLKSSFRLAEEEKENVTPCFVTPKFRSHRTVENLHNRCNRDSRHLVETADVSCSYTASNLTVSSNAEIRSKQGMHGETAQANYVAGDAALLDKLNKVEEFLTMDNPPNLSTSPELDIPNAREFLALGDLKCRTKAREFSRMDNPPNLSTNPELGITNAREFLALGDLKCRTKARGEHGSSTEWMFDPERRCLRDVGHYKSALARSDLNQTRDLDILDFIEGRQTSGDVPLSLGECSHLIGQKRVATDDYEEDEFNIFRKRGKSQQSLKEVNSRSHSCRFLPLFHLINSSPSPELKFYPRKQF